MQQMSFRCVAYDLCHRSIIMPMLFKVFNPSQSGMPADCKGGTLRFKFQFEEEAERGGEDIGTSVFCGKIARL